ncbi:response regulator transcription factor [Isobaculum melis]|uniref:DNA-binding response regulator, OmpR family, contains REC and winged-helix (WHTH) domain n=1 Tax=Isobaculum melis TaxID=142588 RepID=A0A1H9TU62_9LACT|nr:response regulator transcription factor [Isobaculum melis]SES00639.1 DNA-binding response regulator, OmpR family, contains REC and winged-helix (wHTH) domain [Isobaculum melis]
MTQILIVEDDPYINHLLYETLVSEAYTCTQAFSGTEALLCLEKENYELILLDLMLPGISGEQLVPMIKDRSHAAIIVVSSKDALDSKVDLLTVGADDYMTKPFEIQELLARIQVQLRKKNSHQGQLITFQTLTLNQDRNALLVSGKEIPLTHREFKIMALLLSYPKKIFNKQEIYEYAWDEFYIGEDKTVNVHISNIRQKIKKETAEEWIKTVWGVGFTLQS